MVWTSDENSEKLRLKATKRSCRDASSQQELFSHGYQGCPRPQDSRTVTGEWGGVGLRGPLGITVTFKFELGTTDSSGKISGVEIARCSLRLATCFCFFLEKDFCKSSFTVSGGRPSFFLLFLTVIFGARDGLVRPIRSRTLFHRSACPYRIGTPSVDLYYNSPF